MHELSVATGIFEIAEKTLLQNGMKKIHAIHIVIGELTCVDVSALRFSLESAGKGSSIEGAEIVIHKQKAVAECQICKKEFEPIGFVAECPKCKGFETKILKGRELFVKSIEAE
ncbi:MAG: hydrogenase maturation nickel metallochaperone HypA [Bacteroidales bacterium]|nr:hydrogenase maturation nickel metallochaperone HypA [Bacteroidales bacterium]